MKFSDTYGSSEIFQRPTAEGVLEELSDEQIEKIRAKEEKTGTEIDAPLTRNEAELLWEQLQREAEEERKPQVKKLRKLIENFHGRRKLRIKIRASLKRAPRTDR